MSEISAGTAGRSRRLRTSTAVLVAAVAMSGVAIAVTAPPSSAAACNGYVGLTFDDGPAGSTSALLTVLRNNGVRATMFNVGQNVQNNRSAAQAQVAAGMWVANHSWNHAHMTSMNQAQMQSDLSQTSAAIQSATGSRPQLFRPPYGETNATLQSVASSLGMRQVLWDVDSQDWAGVGVNQIVSNASRLQAGQVILMHDNIANTRAAIPQIMANLTSRNLCPGRISPSTGRAVAP
ncbi:polysaccharide deacetylase family protein [Actinomycetes bacterium KLBMP 9797]